MATTYDINNRIELSVHAESPYREMYAAEEILPGKFVYQTAADEVSLTTGNVLAGPLWIAVANTRHGKTIDDAYAVGTRVMIRVLRKGDLVLAWAVGPTTPAIGLNLRKTTTGNLTYNTGADYYTFATSMELWSSISGAERLKVRIVA